MTARDPAVATLARGVASVVLLLAGADLSWRVLQAPMAVLGAALGVMFAWLSIGLVGARWMRVRVFAILTCVVGGAMVAGSGAAFGNATAVLTLEALGVQARYEWLVPVVAAPVIEEGAKVVALWGLAWARPSILAGPLSAALHGALVGIGFAFAENLEFFTMAAVQGGLAGLLGSLYVRALLGGLAHAVFAATGGVALAWPQRSQGSGMAAGFVLLCAMGEHVAWNAIASPAIVRAMCDASATTAACRVSPPAAVLLVEAPLIAAGILLPAALLVVGLVRRPGWR